MSISISFLKKFLTSIVFIATFGFATTINIPADYSTIQAGIDASSDGDTVLVAEGTYVENINYNGKNIVVGSLYLTTSDTSYISSTIIDGDQAGSVVTFDSGENATAVLSGLTVINGYGGNGGNGGGIFCNNSSPSLTNISVSGNSASNNGGGLYLDSSNPSLVNVTITNNTPVGNGGGVYCYDYSNPTFTNVTISNNSAVNNGGGVYLDSSNPSLVNCILWNDAPDELYINDNASVAATYSNIQGGWEGEGNINADPLFMDAGNDDLHLQWGSPCIDSGDPDLDGDGYTWETDNDDQDPNGTRMDMGAFYFSQFISDFTVDLTSGFVPLDVQFTNNSYPNTTNWAWDFDNDGEIDSYEQNPSYTYTQSEMYTVSLLVSDGINEAVEIKENYISVYPPDLIITEIMQKAIIR